MRFDEALGAQRRVELNAGTIEYYERGEGRPILFVHGLGLSATFWRHIAARMARDHRCITPTWPLGGHRHAMDPNAVLDPPAIAALIEEFMIRLDLRDVVLVGNDTGGAFAQIVAARHPERIGALVLTPSDAFKNFLPLQFRPLQLLAHVPGAVWAASQLFRSAVFRRSPLGLGSLSRKRLDTELTRQWAEPLWTNPATRRDVAKVLRGIRVRYTLEAAEALTGFDRPALIVWAESDRVFPVEHARTLAALLPEAHLELISESGCYIPEDAPDRLVVLMHEFLAGSGRSSETEIEEATR
jgi:pimeloyl-ACP methyl ester carboxylesterase